MFKCFNFYIIYKSFFKKLKKKLLSSLSHINMKIYFELFVLLSSIFIITHQSCSGDPIVLGLTKIEKEAILAKHN